MNRSSCSDKVKYSRVGSMRYTVASTPHLEVSLSSPSTTVLSTASLGCSSSELCVAYRATPRRRRGHSIFIVCCLKLPIDMTPRSKQHCPPNRIAPQFDITNSEQQRAATNTDEHQRTSTNVDEHRRTSTNIDEQRWTMFVRGDKERVSQRAIPLTAKYALSHVHFIFPILHYSYCVLYINLNTFMCPQNDVPDYYI